MLTFSGKEIYIFMICMENSIVSGTLNINGLSKFNSSVEVLGESRTLSMANGVLSDPFSGCQVYIYRMKNI